MKKTLIIGASNKPERYSYKAAQSLLNHQHEIEMIGLKNLEIFERKIHTEKINFKDIHTVTMYISHRFQPEYYDYIVSLKPQRVIFNPGTENHEFYNILNEKQIKVEEACTLVLLATNQY